MKSITISAWNIVSLNSVRQKADFTKYIQSKEFDFLCFSETKLNGTEFTKYLEPEIMKKYPYIIYNNCVSKKGYSGVMIMTKHQPLQSINGFIENTCNEGRIITLIYKSYILITVYVKNAGEKLQTLNQRLQWDLYFHNHISKLKKIYPYIDIILCGDFNIVHQSIDIYDNKLHTRYALAGCTIAERESFEKLLSLNFIDAYRYKYPESHQYTYWSYSFNCRNNNKGWRIDYFLVSDSQKVVDCTIRDDINGSDHCPIELVYNINESDSEFDF